MLENASGYVEELFRIRRSSRLSPEVSTLYSESFMYKVIRVDVFELLESCSPRGQSLRERNFFLN